MDALLVARLGERPHGDVGDVVGIDDCSRTAPAGRRDDALEHGVAEEVLAEVLGEEAAPDDRRGNAGTHHDLLARLRVGFASTRQQHDPVEPVSLGGGGEGRHGIRGAGGGEVRLVRDVGGPDAVERGRPGVGVVPVEGGNGGARHRADVVARGGQSVGDAPAGLAVGTDHEDRSGGCRVRVSVMSTIKPRSSETIHGRTLEYLSLRLES